jgi:hypothetical protein
LDALSKVTPVVKNAITKLSLQQRFYPFDTFAMNLQTT